MQKFKIQIAIIVMALGVVNSPQWRGQLKVLTAPSLSGVDINIAKVSKDEQVKILLKFEHQICSAITPCLDETRTHQGETIVQLCNQSANKLASIPVPAELPDSVVQNLQLYHQSSINTSRHLADSWGRTTSSSDGGSFWGFFKRWEIDTCGYKSIPQQIRRLYELDKLAGKKLVNCKEIEELYISRLPASK
jgi:hypothetical protein